MQNDQRIVTDHTGSIPKNSKKGTRKAKAQYAGNTKYDFRIVNIYQESQKPSQ